MAPFPRRSPTRSPALLLAAVVLGAGPALAPPLMAQSEGREPGVVELPVGARAAGLGDAFQLGSDDSDAIFHHPGLMGTLTGMMVGYQHLGEVGRLLTLSAATDWYGGGVAVGLQALSWESPGAGERPAGLDPFLNEGPVGASELVATVGYGRAVGPLRLGVAGKLLSQRFGSDSETRGSVDLGASTPLGPGRVALSVRNLGADDVVAGTEVSQPVTATLAFGGYGARLWPLDVGAAGAITRRGDGEWIGGGGLELGYWPVVGRTFVARVGARTVPEGEASPLTLGGSFWGDDLVVEYAWQPVDGMEGVHRVSLGWR